MLFSNYLFTIRRNITGGYTVGQGCYKGWIFILLHQFQVQGGGVVDWETVQHFLSPIELIIFGRDVLALCFLTPRLPGQSSPQLLDLQLRLHMPPTKGLHWHWDEGQACPPTGVTRSCHLPGEVIVQGVARGGSHLADQSCLQGIDHGHVQCCIPTPGPVGDKDIRRPDLWPRDKCSVLPGGTKSCTYCCVEECVPQVVVSCNGWTAIVLKIANSLQIDQNSLHPHTSASLVHIFIQLVHGAEAVDLALTTKFASGSSGTENWQLLLYVYPSIGSKYQPLPPPQKAS